MTATESPGLNSLLEAYELRKTYADGQVALRGVSLSLARGELVALVGGSGSGKSTVARILTRVLPPTGGSIIFRGREVLVAEPVRASLAYRAAVQMVFQDPFASLNPVHTVFHHVARPLRRHGRVGPGAAAVRDRVEQLLADVGLTPAAAYVDKRPGALSGGQRQRVAIARALAVEPQVIIADEPTSMLDVSLRGGVLALLTRLKRERGLAILMITHDLASACTVADRILVLHAGQIVESGPPAHLVESPTHAYTRRLLEAAPDPWRGAATAASTPQKRGPNEPTLSSEQKPQ
jgi:peptide/nickel transport system ATP-binding protein